MAITKGWSPLSPLSVASYPWVVPPTLCQPRSAAAFTLTSFVPLFPILIQIKSSSAINLLDIYKYEGTNITKNLDLNNITNLSKKTQPVMMYESLWSSPGGNDLTVKSPPPPLDNQIFKVWN